MRLLRKSWKFADVAALCALAVLLVGNSGFAFRCGVEEHQMNRLARVAQQRRQACLDLGLRWEADDQEKQYRPGSSAGTNATVGPISGLPTGDALPLSGCTIHVYVLYSRGGNADIRKKDLSDCWPNRNFSSTNFRKYISVVLL